MRVVVSDTSPIRYLVLIGLDNLLRDLYDRIFIPDAVARELASEGTPDVVRQWMSDSPSWVDLVPTVAEEDDGPITVALDIGERQVILAALRMRANLVLVDERAGAAEARRLGLTVTGTLGVIARSAERGWLNLKPALDKLQKSNFRVHPDVIQSLLLADAKRRS